MPRCVSYGSKQMAKAAFAPERFLGRLLLCHAAFFGLQHFSVSVLASSYVQLALICIYLLIICQLW